MHFYMKNEIARTVVEAEDHDENNGHVLLGQGSTIFSEAGRVMVWHICVLDSCLINFFNQSRYRLKRFKKTGSAVSGPGITYVNDLVPRIPLSFQRKGRREAARKSEINTSQQSGQTSNQKPVEKCFAN